MEDNGLEISFGATNCHLAAVMAECFPEMSRMSKGIQEAKLFINDEVLETVESIA